MSDYEWPDELRIKPDYWLEAGGWIAFTAPRPEVTLRLGLPPREPRLVAIARARTALRVTERLDP